MKVPADLLYSKDHSWVRQEGVDMRVGITDFAQNEYGEIVFVELPKVGEQVQMNEPFGSLESVKTVSELYAPISGTVVEVNEVLADSPETVNASPYEKAWMIVIEPADDAELDELLSATEYTNHISDE